MKFYRKINSYHSVILLGRIAILTLIPFFLHVLANKSYVLHDTSSIVQVIHVSKGENETLHPPKGCEHTQAAVSTSMHFSSPAHGARAAVCSAMVEPAVL